MSHFIIEGPSHLKGDFYPQGNKNESFPILSATLLSQHKVTLHNVPIILDVIHMLDILSSLNIKINKLSKNSFELDTSTISLDNLDIAKIRTLRGSLTLIAPLLHRFSEFYFPEPGGDKIGLRKLDTILDSLKEMGVEIDYDPNNQLYLFKAAKIFYGKEILLQEASVTGTENLILLSVLAKGKTIIRNAASEPHVEYLCHFLNALGAKINGIGSNKLEIEGVNSLEKKDYHHYISSDYLEIGSIIGLAATTQSEVKIHHVIPKDILMILNAYKKLGISTFYENEKTLVIPKNQERKIQKDFHNRIQKIDDGPWPNIPADIMSIIIVTATQCEGTILIHEKMFESRLYFIDKLILMGANIILCDPHRAIISGPSPLFGRDLYSPDIRAGISLLIAACAAKGTSYIYHIDQIDRGYENIEERLVELGVNIKRELSLS